MAVQRRVRWHLGLAGAVLVCGLAMAAYLLAHEAGMDRLTGQLRDRLTLSYRIIRAGLAKRVQAALSAAASFSVSKKRARSSAWDRTSSFM